MTALEVSIERKVYARARGGGVTALEGLRFSVAENDFVCILGPSGCGKTTALNLIAGLDKDFQGEITLGGAAAGRRIAYVFQTPRLLPWRSAIANLTLAAGSDPVTAAKCRALLAEVGLGGYEDAFPAQLSLGMQRRAALARAFAVEPGLLLMDEPFVSLDEATAIRLRALLLTLWRERPATVLFVTHDVREAIQLGQRLLVLSGSPARLVADLRVPLSLAERADPQALDAFRKEKLGFLAEARAPAEPALYDNHMNRAIRP
jgi:ABC-type nitrate/sulfonate/bicarbonate transport system ATPase subunit